MSVDETIAAFEEALRLAVFAPTEEKAEAAVTLAEEIAAMLPSRGHVEFSKKVVEVQIASGVYTASDYA